MKISAIFLLLVVTTVNSEELVGHGKPLGSHRKSDGHLDILEDFPTPKEFWDKYMSIGKPCIFRGAGNSFPATSKWTNDYLKENYGHMEVKLEHKYEKKKTPVGSRGVGRDTIKSFLDTYLDESKYIVSQLPDPMAKDIYVLPFLTCGSFKDRLLEANLWLSSGGSKSLLHKDADNAINCLINGTKDWLLIHPNYTDKLPVAKGDSGYGGFTTLNVDKVNLKKYPDMQHVHYNHANMKPGDCLFLPKSYWHQVSSFGIQNLAVSMLFSRLSAFNDKGCHDDLQYVPLSEAGLVWTYPGHGAQTLGNIDPYELKDEMNIRLRKAKKTKFVARDFETFLPEREYDEETEDGELFDVTKEREVQSKLLLDIFDVEGKGYVTADDIKSAGIEQMKQVATVMDSDPANTEEYEHFLFSPKAVKEIIERSIVDGSLKKDLVLKSYQSIGGSESMALELFHHLSGNDDVKQEEVSKELVMNNMQRVLKLYEKQQKADKSGEFYDQSLQDDKQRMEKTEDLLDSYVENNNDDNDDNDDAESFDDLDDADHEPNYQPADDQKMKMEFRVGNDRGGGIYVNQDKYSSQSNPNGEAANDQEELDDNDDGFLDENDDGYPDHEPMYQPSEDDFEEGLAPFQEGGKSMGNGEAAVTRDNKDEL